MAFTSELKKEAKNSKESKAALAALHSAIKMTYRSTKKDEMRSILEKKLQKHKIKENRVTDENVNCANINHVAEEKMTPSKKRREKKKAKQQAVGPVEPRGGKSDDTHEDLQKNAEESFVYRAVIKSSRGPVLESVEETKETPESIEDQEQAHKEMNRKAVKENIEKLINLYVSVPSNQSTLQETSKVTKLSKPVTLDEKSAPKSRLSAMLNNLKNRRTRKTART